MNASTSLVDPPVTVTGSVHPPVLTRLAVLGDSFSASRQRMGRTWVEHMVGWLTDANPDLDYENVAVPGATSRDVLNLQLPPVRAFHPDVVTVVCGANDVLLSEQPDIAGYAAALSEVVCSLREDPCVRIVTATCPDHVAGLPLNPRVRLRLENGIDLLNEATRSVARRHQVSYVELGRRSGRDHPGAAPETMNAAAIAAAFELAVARAT